MRPGPVQLRVWQLSFRTDFGLANMIDPDELELLVEMILVEGFLGLPIWLGWTCWYASRLPLDQIESFSFSHYSQVQNMRWSTRRWETSCVQPWCSILDSALRALATTWPGFHAAMLYTVNDFCDEFPTCDLFLEFSSCKLRQPWARAIFSGFCERLEKVSLLPHYLRRHQESRNPIWGTLNQFQGQAIKQNLRIPCALQIYAKWWESWILTSFQKSHHTCFWGQASLRVVYGAVGRYGGVKDRLNAHRGITMGSVATRRAPNCFNFLRQIQILEKSGLDGKKTFTVPWWWIILSSDMWIILKIVFTDWLHEVQTKTDNPLCSPKRPRSKILSF